MNLYFSCYRIGCRDVGAKTGFMFTGEKRTMSPKRSLFECDNSRSDARRRLRLENEKFVQFFSGLSNVALVSFFGWRI
jgi:hypothetical protein